MSITAPSVPKSTSPTAWPRAAQWAGLFVLGLVVAFLIGRFFHIGSRPRPTERERVIVLAPIDLNQAGKSELLQLPGVGDHLADAILSARNERGGFQTIDELREVKGIGPTRFDTLRPWLRLDLTTNPVSADVASRKEPTGKPTALRTGGKKEPPANTRIDVNKASSAELQRLPGVGPVLAGRIIAEREKSPFRSPEDLRRVSGIGAKTLEKLRPFISVDSTRDNEVAVAQ